jgi:hypothetical protein
MKRFRFLQPATALRAAQAWLTGRQSSRFSNESTRPKPNGPETGPPMTDAEEQQYIENAVLWARASQIQKELRENVHDGLSPSEVRRLLDLTDFLLDEISGAGIAPNEEHPTQRGLLAAVQANLEGRNYLECTKGQAGAAMFMILKAVHGLDNTLYGWPAYFVKDHVSEKCVELAALAIHTAEHCLDGHTQAQAAWGPPSIADQQILSDDDCPY